MNSTAEERGSAVLQTPGLVAFWDFQENGGELPVSQGKVRYALREGREAIAKAAEGVFGPSSADIAWGQWYEIARRDCPALDFHGETAFTVGAWLKRSGDRSHPGGCEAVAGMWNETERHRQYCLFLNLQIWDSSEQACGHVSAEGGPTPGYRYCMTSAIGKSPVAFSEWHFVAFTFDGKQASVYLDGSLDEREGFNPYPYPKPLYDGGPGGADFTVGAVNRSGEMGNFYHGLIGGLAIYDRCLSPRDIEALHRATEVPNP